MQNRKRKSNDLSIIIPVYNSALTIELVCSSLTNAIIPLNINYELILVDDCSTDESFKILRNLSIEDCCIKAIKLKENSGQHVAIHLGLQYASGKYILLLDDDMPRFAEYFPLFWENMKDGWDVISGKRSADSLPGRKNLRKILMICTSLFYRKKYRDFTSPIKLFKMDLVKETLKHNVFNLLIPEYVMLQTERVLEIPLQKSVSLKNASRYTYKKLFIHATLLLFTFFYSFNSYFLGKVPLLSKNKNDLIEEVSGLVS